jgi:hypothetical protein
MDVMVQFDLLQLRVLAGMHEGAVVPLSDKPTSWQLARGPDADVLLRDAPGQAQLSRQGHVWIWRDADFEQILQPGQVWRWGPMVLSLALADQPWPEAWPELVFDRQPLPLGDQEVAGSPKEPADDAPPPETSPTELVPPQVELNAQPPVKAAAARRVTGLLKQWAKRPVMLIAVAALALAFIMVLLASLILGQGKVPTTVASVPPAVSAPVDMDRIKRILAGMGLLESVEVKVRQDGRLLLRGVVADNEQLESLIAAVSRQARRYTPQLLTQSEFESRARALSRNLPEGIDVLAEPDGQMVLQARRDDVDWSLARQLVEVDLPEVVGVEYRPRAKGELLQPLAQLDGNALPSTSSRVVMPALPAFAVVVGGARPYVVLADGRKWQPGGKINTLLLVSIDDQSIVFEDAHGNSFNKPR